MSRSPFNARHLDVAAFAEAGASLAGEWPADDFARLQQGQTADAAPAAAVIWAASGELRTPSDGLPRIGLNLRAHTSLRVQCQRCLQPMTLALQVQTRLRFAADDAQAERLDPDCDDDVLALPPALDLQPLIEDELILSLPAFPRHDRCVPPGPTATETVPPEGETNANPFAVLEALRRGPGGGLV